MLFGLQIADIRQLATLEHEFVYKWLNPCAFKSAEPGQKGARVVVPGAGGAVLRSNCAARDHAMGLPGGTEAVQKISVLTTEAFTREIEPPGHALGPSGVFSPRRTWQASFVLFGTAVVPIAVFSASRGRGENASLHALRASVGGSLCCSFP